MHLITKEANASFWTAKEQASPALLLRSIIFLYKSFLKVETTRNNKKHEVFA